MDNLTVIPNVNIMGVRLSLQTKDACAIAIAAVALVLVTAVRCYESWQKRNIPHVGYWWLPSIFQLTTLSSRLSFAFKKYPDSVFTTPVFPFGSMAVANSRRLIEEIRSAPDEVFSTRAVLGTFVQSELTIGPILAKNNLHKSLIRSHLAQNMQLVFPEIVEESELSIKNAFRSVTENGWTAFPALHLWTEVFAQAGNRVFVGPEICKNELYRQDMLAHAMQVMQTAYIINAFPKLLHSIVAWLVARPDLYIKRVAKMLGPSIQATRKGIQTLGSAYSFDHNNVLTWLIEENSGKSDTDEEIVASILFMNFASIHTASSVFTHAIYDLATYPEHVSRLRKEIKDVINEHGWTMGAVQELHSIDSFLRESARLNPTILVALPREVLADYRFSDGALVKKGTFLGASMMTAHFDPVKYPEPNVFKPWRFYANDNSEAAVKTRFTTPSAEYLPFGAGKHACPGRFFANYLMKVLFTIVILNYDIKLEKEGVRPPSQPIGNSVIPNSTANILLKARNSCKMFPSDSLQ